jgi:hypothetical protein
MREGDGFLGSKKIRLSVKRQISPPGFLISTCWSCGAFLIEPSSLPRYHAPSKHMVQTHDPQIKYPDYAHDSNKAARSTPSNHLEKRSKLYANPFCSLVSTTTPFYVNSVWKLADYETSWMTFPTRFLPPFDRIISCNVMCQSILRDCGCRTIDQSAPRLISPNNPSESAVLEIKVPRTYENGTRMINTR